jgi:hypothetical protein
MVTYNIFNHYSFSVIPPTIGHYLTRVRSRVTSAYRPSTLQAHRTSTTALAMFCVFFDLEFPLVSEITLLAFLEFLVESSLGVASIKNYFSAIKSYFMSFNIPVTNFASHQLTLALTSLTKNSNLFFHLHNSKHYCIDPPSCL